MWVKYAVPDSLVFFLFSSSASCCCINSPTDLNSQRILPYDDSKDVVWRKDVPLMSELLKSTFRGSKSPKTAPVEKSQPKRKRPKMLNNFVIRRNESIVVLNHCLEI